MLNRLWVYKFFMILKYCNRWYPLIIQENKLNSPAGNRTLVSRVTGGDTHHYTTEDYLSLNRLWVYKFFMILKYCNRWHSLLIQENNLNSPAGNRTLVSRVTGGDTHHYTTEDSLCWTGCEFTNSMILKYCNRWHSLLIQENNLNSPAGNRTLVSRVTGADTHHYTTEDCLCWTGCEFINSLWFWSNVIDGVLY